MTISEFVDRFETRRSGKGWLMKCPTHDDRFPSLSISEGKDGCVLLKCHAGCDLDAILLALGITKKDLFPERMFASNNPKFQRRSEAKPAHDHDRVPFDWQKCVAAFTEEHATVSTPLTISTKSEPRPAPRHTGPVTTTRRKTKN